MNPLLRLRKKLAETVQRMTAITETAAKENRDITDDETKQFDELEAEVARIKQDIAREERLEKLRAETLTTLDGTVQVPPVARAEVTADQSNKGEKGHKLARFVRALAATKGIVQYAAEHARKVFGDESVAKALEASTMSAGGAMVPTPMTAEVIEYLRPLSVIRSLDPRLIPMPNGNITMPRITGGATATYIGENQNVGKTEQTTGQVKMTAKKLAALVPFSNDLVRFASTQVDTLVRDDIVQALATAEDSTFIRALGTAYSPTGLRYLAASANLINVNATVNLANISQDLGKLPRALKTGNIPEFRPAWIISPRTEWYLKTIQNTNGAFVFRDEMDRGLLWGKPFKVTNNIPENLAVTNTNETEIYYAEFSEVMLGEVPNLGVSVSDTAAYHDGSNVVAAFSLDQTVVRIIAEHDIALRHSEACAVLIDVDWGA